MRASTRKLVTEALKKLLEADAPCAPGYSASVIELATFLERPGPGGRPKKPTSEDNGNHAQDISVLQNQVSQLRAQVEKLQLKSGLRSMAGA